MFQIWPDIHHQWKLEKAWKGPHRRKAIYLLRVWQGFQSDVHLKTHETQERSPLLVPNLTSHLQWGVIWRTMKESTQEKSLLLVQSVRSDSQKVVIWKSICLFKGWEVIHRKWSFQNAWKDPHSREANCLFQKWKAICKKWLFENAWKNPHSREAICVLLMCQVIHR